jgi:Spy/CpxP family protein refolding chaperone
VSTGKVILVVLATLVIFGTGLLTGVVLTKQAPKIAEAPAKPPMVPMGPGMQQFFHRIQAELDLTPEQHQRIAMILRESQERSRGFAGSEFRNVREQIHAELTPPQHDKFERLLKERQRRAQDFRSTENRPSLRSNGPMSLEGQRRFPVNRGPNNLPPGEPPQ